MEIVNKNFGGGKNKGIIIMKFIAALLITYSHMGILFPRYGGLVTGGAIGDGLFFFCSGFTLFLGRTGRFVDWYKRRINRIYPTIIMWALLSSIAFSWEWSVTDMITTPRYWFIPCIMVYYMIFYIIRRYMINHLVFACVIACTIVVVSSFFVLDMNRSVMYADVAYMRIYYFLFMLLGAITALHEEKEISAVKSFLYAVSGLVVYYACMGIYKVDPFYCNFQVISLMPLLFAIYWMYRFCNTNYVCRILDGRTGLAIYFISSLTLEIYMVQYAIFTNSMNGLFPLNIIITYILIFVAAYVLKCSSKVFSQIFSNETFSVHKVLQV